MANIDANVCGDILDMDFVALKEQQQLELPDNPKQNCTEAPRLLSFVPMILFLDIFLRFSLDLSPLFGDMS